MLRFVGVLLLCLGGTLIGLGGAKGLKSRVDTLLSFLSGLSLMEAEMQFHLTPMPELLKKLSRDVDGPAKAFFFQCKEALWQLEDTPLSVIWRKNLHIEALTLEEEDRQVLEQLGAVLGQYDLDGQMRAIGSARLRLEECLEKANARRTSLGRVYSALGMAAGILSVLLLI